MCCYKVDCEFILLLYVPGVVGTGGRLSVSTRRKYVRDVIDAHCGILQQLLEATNYTFIGQPLNHRVEWKK